MKAYPKQVSKEEDLYFYVEAVIKNL